mmetsp:Transcript_4436/g.10966  ORF Transcript_4436/g.10966 Transcript_4436/m.10966 type:complete len:887 (-) Transcript_4436:203-2863(-)|eukprot:CAMPEP_0177641986 /NCGR_PEP_ID=MMETSP0447-20121125/7351_1 /TAXON_ID=0 /ORGANISM="Stygamoeba regulata, Strain BSH-02190019" /LENGTH=886 /DNA_ID=CAMNT_0019144125 /DNA_START=138 /DNA_END=2798 /DNA_ORIENTATION=-
MEWQPQPQGLEQIAGLLKHTQSPDNQVQQQVNKQLGELRQIPDFSNYLMFICSKGVNEPELVRVAAGLILKNNIRFPTGTIAPEVLNYLKRESINALADSSVTVRRTMASVIGSIVQRVELANWPDLFQNLFCLLDSNNPHGVDGALCAIELLCEDVRRQLVERAPSPLDELIPRLLTFFQHPEAKARSTALRSLNCFMEDLDTIPIPPAFIANMERFMQGVFALSNDPSPVTRRLICSAISKLIHIRIDYLAPHMKDIIPYILRSSQDPDEELALEACEFWSSIANLRGCEQILKDYLPVVIPALLQGMVYSDDDPDLIDCNREDAAVPDDPRSIEPHFHRQSLHQQQNEDDEDDEDADGSYSPEWNFRKCSASGLDKLSMALRDDILPFLLPLLQTKLNEDVNWKEKEAAILALGAVSEGCLHGMERHLSALAPYLVSQLSHKVPLVRSITCWSVSRYSRWIVENEENTSILPRVMQELLQRVLDSNKKVQVAACSALATFEDEPAMNLRPFLEPIVSTFRHALGRYQAGNLASLYDAISSMAEAVKQSLREPQFMEVLLPPLIERFTGCKPEDHNLCPLLECLTAIVLALGPDCASFAPVVYVRCVNIIEATLQSQQMAEQSDTAVPLSKDLIMCALDLIGGLAESLEAAFEQLVGSANLIPVIGACATDSDHNVRQWAFALVGEIAKCCCAHLRPILEQLISILIKNMDPVHLNTCNNACWAYSEIMLREPEACRPFFPQSIQIALHLLSKVRLPTLNENIAIVLGRMALVSPDIVSGGLQSFLPAWCEVLGHMNDTYDKETACRGLCLAVENNPVAAQMHFPLFCKAIASWKMLHPELKQVFEAILLKFKHSMPQDAWDSYLASEQFSPVLRHVLKSKYNL